MLGLVSARRLIEAEREIARLRNDLEHRTLSAANALHAQLRAETMAEVRKEEVLRLERVLAGLQSPLGGGFLPIAIEDPAPQQTAQIDVCWDRISEVTDGLPLDEIERRHRAFNSRQVDAWQAERDEITAELKGL